jgi:hypothetical protein
MQRLLREPLLHFLILGALLFVLYARVDRDGLQSPDEVVVDQAQVDALVTRFQRTWQRAPTRDELRGPAWTAATRWCAGAWCRT